MHPPLLERFEERCRAAKTTPTAVMKAAGIHPSYWWKWTKAPKRVSPTLKNFEAMLVKLAEMGGDPCGCQNSAEPEPPKGAR